MERNLFDEAARVLALPIPRRKALKHVAAGFAGAALSFLWPKRAVAYYDWDKPCYYIVGCPSDGICFGKHIDDPCTLNGVAGHCARKCANSNGNVACYCAPGPAPDTPEISAIPDVSIRREDSLAAGNCVEGTDFVASWFPGRDSVSAREAAAQAIARGKPKLARYIARTAYVVDRGAEV
jgi:hypothetical protein